jgi:hypothetical protein
MPELGIHSGEMAGDHTIVLDHGRKPSPTIFFVLIASRLNTEIHLLALST